jgi:hypothetical protein
MLLSWRQMTPKATSDIPQNEPPLNAPLIRPVPEGQGLRAVTWTPALSLRLNDQWPSMAKVIFALIL